MGFNSGFKGLINRKVKRTPKSRIFMECLLLGIEFKLCQIDISHAPIILVYVQVGGKHENLQFYIKCELISVGDLVSQQNNCPALGQFLVYLHGTCFSGPKVEPHV